MVMVILTKIADGDRDDGDSGGDSDTNDGDDYSIDSGIGDGDYGDSGIGGDEKEDGDQIVVIMMVVCY